MQRQRAVDHPPGEQQHQLTDIVGRLLQGLAPQGLQLGHRRRERRHHGLGGGDGLCQLGLGLGTSLGASTGLGLGDVKLLGMIGAVVGPLGVLDTILASSLVGLVLGGAQALARGALGRPFGFAPAIAVGTVAILFLPRMWLLHVL